MPDEQTQRDVLPIPDRPYDGPVYEDAKDPEAKVPPIGPPAGVMLLARWATPSRPR
jgi:hypothetical protein